MREEKETTEIENQPINQVNLRHLVATPFVQLNITTRRLTFN